MKYQDLVSEEDWLLAMDGRARCVGDGVGRREILSDAYVALAPEQAAPHVLTDGAGRALERPQPGDFLVAGLDFAVDANEKIFPAALRSAGFAAVIARRCGHFFLRNAVHIGLPLLIVEETAAIKPGDRLRVDIEAHIVANKSSGDRYVIRNLPPEDVLILRAGGLIAYTRERQGKTG